MKSIKKKNNFLLKWSRVLREKEKKIKRTKTIVNYLRGINWKKQGEKYLVHLEVDVNKTFAIFVRGDFFLENKNSSAKKRK